MNVKLPAGYRLVYNRLATPYERFFDGRAYAFEPHETQPLPEEVAQFLSEASIFSEDLALNTDKRALILDGEPDFETPFDGEMPVERLDRSTDPEPVVKNAGLEDGPRRTEYKQLAGMAGDLAFERKTKQPERARTSLTAPA